MSLIITGRKPISLKVLQSCMNQIFQHFLKLIKNARLKIEMHAAKKIVSEDYHL